MNEAVFNIKIISSGRLVLVESKHFNAEIFKPEIINGRIQLKNIVKQRRCCGSEVLTEKINIINVAKLQNKFPISTIAKASDCSTQDSLVKVGNVSATNVVYEQRATHSFESSISSVNASNSDSQLSEPDVLRDAAFHRSTTSNLRIPGLYSALEIAQPSFFGGPTIPTPENSHHPLFKTPRKVTGISPTFATPQSISKRLNNSLRKLPTPKLGPNIKVVRLHRKPTEGTPRKVAKIVPLNRGNPVSSTPKNLNQSVRIPPSPGTVTKWRKCLTPARTYSRRPSQQNKQIPRSVRKDRKQSSIYFKNATVGRQGDAILHVRRVCLKIDTQTSIGVAEFKNQMKTADDLKKKSVSEIKTKEDLFNAKFVSFDLLTNPYRNKSFSESLRRMFRKRCVQKFARTDPKYKHLLDDIPALTELPKQRKRFTI